MRRIAALSLFLSPWVLSCTFKPVNPIQPAPEVIATEEFEQVINDSADILFVIDDSGSMFEEQFNLLENTATFIEIIAGTGADLRFATVTTDGVVNTSGNFFQRPLQPNGSPFNNRDTIVGTTLVRDIPDAFCDAVLTNSNNGVLDPLDYGAVGGGGFLDQDGAAGDLRVGTPGIQIPNFTGRRNLEDFDGDGLADNPDGGFLNDGTGNAEDILTATFADAVSCVIAVGVRGNGAEMALCQAAAAVDTESLGGLNGAFLNDADSVLAVIFLGDEDDCSLASSDVNGKFSCAPPQLNADTGSLRCSQPSTENICGRGQGGDFDNLVGVSVFADRIKALRDDDKTFIATIAGPPGTAVADCANPQNLPVPTCSDPNSGQASPGNRLFAYAGLFQNNIDSIAAPICNDFAGIIADIAADLGQLLSAGCLNAPIDVAEFDPLTDMKVKINIATAIDVASCGEIVDVGGQAVADTDPDDPTGNTCIVKSEFIDVINSDACSTGLAATFIGFNIPIGSLVTIIYLSLPQ